MEIKKYLIIILAIILVSNISIALKVDNKIIFEKNLEPLYHMENKIIPNIDGYSSKWINFESEKYLENNQSYYLIQNDNTKILDNSDLTPLIIQITESTVTNYIQTLTSFGPRVTGTAACNDAGDYIASIFSGMGLNVRIQQWSSSGYEGDNIEATLEGIDDTSDEIYIVCAHYDSVPGSPGADDNAAGTAAVLASAKVMSQYEFTHTVRFVAFSGEEQGLIGSSIYASESALNGDNIAEVLNVDMIGYTETQEGTEKIGVYGSATIATQSQMISDTYQDLIYLTVENYGASPNSDHWPFLQEGYDAVMYHEYEFNDYYHSPQDTIDKMNLDYDMRVTRMIMGTLAFFSNFEPNGGGGGYLVRPTVSIEYPNYGSSINGVINITGRASDINGYIEYVAVKIDNENWDYAEITSGEGNYMNWKFSWDTTEEDDDTHLISAIAINNHGIDSPTTFSRVDVVNDMLTTQIIGKVEGKIGEALSLQSITTGGFPPYEYNWDLDDGSTYNNENITHYYQIPGEYNIKLIVKDSENNTAEDNILVNIIDDISPTIEIKKPTNSLYILNKSIVNIFKPIVIGQIDIILAVNDNFQVNNVLIFINEQEKENIKNPPYVWTWDEFGFGKYTIKAYVFDKAGNQANQTIDVSKFF